MSSTGRLMKEIQMLNTKPVAGISCKANEADVLDWEMKIAAPPEYSVGNEVRASPYAGKTFIARLRFPANYPFNHPTVTFLPETLWHPQVEFKTGSVCSEDLSAMWGPTKTVGDVGKFMISFLGNPSPGGASNTDAAAQLRDNVKEFEKNASNAAAKLS